MTIFDALYFFTIFIAFIFSSIRFIHIFQLESYLKPQYLKWITRNYVFDIVGRGILVILSAAILLIKTNTITLFLCSVLNIFTIYFYRPQKAKKPLVFTARVKRLLTTSVVLFILLTVVFAVFKLIFLLPLIFILTAYIVILAAIINAPVEKTIRKKYINEAKRIISARKNNLIVIGITGSYGKTSTKYYLEKILSKKYNVLMTPASYNTTMGVVKVVREMLKPSHEIFICEMGARNTGEIKEICDIVLPDYGIITSVGPQHLETFKTIENVINTKFELADAISDDGKTVLNGDYETIMCHETHSNYVYYGVENHDTTYFAADISCSASGTSFSLNYPDGVVSLSTKLIGKHNVQNIVAACTQGLLLGVSPDDVKIAVKMLESVPHRLEIINGGDIVIIDDAFNSNPAGSAYAIDALGYFDGLKVLVTPGMVELGTKQNELNFAFGEHAAKICDYIYIVGNENYDSISNGAKNAGFDVENKLKQVLNPNEAVDMVRAMQSDRKKYVLLENDLPDNFK